MGLYHSEPLTSKDAQRYCDDVVESIRLLESKVSELEDIIETMKAQHADDMSTAEEKGYNEGYYKGCKEMEKKYNPKFVFR